MGVSQLNTSTFGAWCQPQFAEFFKAVGFRYSEMPVIVELLATKQNELQWRDGDGHFCTHVFACGRAPPSDEEVDIIRCKVKFSRCL